MIGKERGEKILGNFDFYIEKTMNGNILLIITCVILPSSALITSRFFMDLKLK